MTAPKSEPQERLSRPTSRRPDSQHDRSGALFDARNWCTFRRPLTARDRLMARLGERYPGYGFERHAGYGTTEHMDAVAKLGPTPEHRLSFNARCFAGAVVAAPTRRRKPRRASWRELPAAEMAAHLLETPTIADRVWTDEPRLTHETRTAFIRRVLLGETEPVEAPEGEDRRD